MARDQHPMADDEMAELCAEVATQRENMCETLADEFGEAPEEYRADRLVTDDE